MCQLLTLGTVASTKPAAIHFTAIALHYQRVEPLVAMYYTVLLLEHLDFGLWNVVGKMHFKHLEKNLVSKERRR